MISARLNFNASDFALKQSELKTHVRDVMEEVGDALAKAFKTHFKDLDKTKSKFGHNFYTREGAGKTDYEINADGVSGKVIVRSYAMAHALHGGTVSAKNTKYLAIPVSNEARRQTGGARDANIAGLAFVPTAKGGILMTRSKSSRSMTVHYLLRKSVKHNPRQYVIPEQDVLEAAAARAVKNL